MVTIYIPHDARVFIVEDNQERIDWFRWKLNEIGHAHIVCLTDDPHEAIERLSNDCDPGSLDAIFLDFDLGHSPMINDPEKPEQVTSAPVVEYLMMHRGVRIWDKNVVIHSQNQLGAQWIKARLLGATVAPFGTFDIKERRKL